MLGYCSVLFIPVYTKFCSLFFSSVHYSLTKPQIITLKTESLRWANPKSGSLTFLLSLFPRMPKGKRWSHDLWLDPNLLARVHLT